MALVLGTNAGFVTTTPTADPAEGGAATDGLSRATKDTSDSTAKRITKIGWFQTQTDNGSTNFEVGLYSDNGAGEPHLLLEVVRTNSLAVNTKGWNDVDVDWVISGSTIYWLAVQADEVSPLCGISFSNTGGNGQAQKSPSTTLTSDWENSSSTQAEGIIPVYAVWSDTAAPSSATDNMNIIGENVY